MKPVSDVAGREPEDFSARVSRRVVLQGAASAAFLIAFDMPARAVGATRPAGARPLFNSFLAIGTDNLVTAILAQTEGGQGNSTGMTQVIAAELGADWAMMRYQFTTERRPEYINPILYKGLVLTAGSSSITGFYDTLRKAAAMTREMLIAAAAKRWGVIGSACVAENSFIKHVPSKRQLTFGELAAAAAKEPMATNVRLRTLREMPLIGQRLSRLDAPAKCNGSARFGFDFEAPGMLYAAVRHGPAYGSSVTTLDISKAKSMPGVVTVMAVPQGVAVVADQYWRAVKALAEVREAYSVHPNASTSSATVEASLQKALSMPGIATPGGRGDVATAMKSATKILEMEFSQPILAHACMEPVSCTASVEGDRCEIWLSTKSTTIDAKFAADALGIDPASVIVNNEYQGGDFGRRSGCEHVTEAVLLSKAVKRPVKVVWTRTEDLHIDQHRTAVQARVRLALGSDGMPTAYEAKVACDGVWQRMFPWWYAQTKPLDLPMFTMAGSAYAIPNEAGSYVNVEMPVRIGPHRGNGDAHNGFLLETMIDEAAHEVGQDPLLYRRKLLAKDARSVAVLDRAAKLSGWGRTGQGRFHGVAYMQSEFYRCRLAIVVEVSRRPEGIHLERAIGVCESGLIVNPLLAERCIEGGIIFGLSNAMYERITLSGGAPDQTNFHDYRLLRCNEAPDVSVEVSSVGEVPGAIGEIGSIPVAAALGNAVFKATGKRVRTLPFALNGIAFV